MSVNKRMKGYVNLFHRIISKIDFGKNLMIKKKFIFKKLS